jgi:hypothetical protein
LEQQVVRKNTSPTPVKVDSVSSVDASEREPSASAGFQSIAVPISPQPRKRRRKKRSPAALQERAFRKNVRRLDREDKRDVAIRNLNKLMLNERYYARVAQDPALFAKMYHRVKAPDTEMVKSVSPGIAAKPQEIHSAYDQLHYILARTGTAADPNRPARGLANQQGWSKKIGTEVQSEMTQATARSVQMDALARLIRLFAGEQTRMPMYAHRAGPMLESAKAGRRAPGEVASTSASNLNAILGSADKGGANIRVTQADRGPGAYVSTDSDNFYGPHGITLDPRDLHQLPLSGSEDNSYEAHAERSTGHQFRALGVPIMLTDAGGPAYSSIFVGTDSSQVGELSKQLQPSGFTPGILANTTHDLLKSALSQAAARDGYSPPEKPPAIRARGLKEQPVSNEHAFMMQSMVQELSGLYEPHAWTTRWRERERIFGQVAEAGQKMASRVKEPPPSKEEHPVKDDEWDD